MLLALTPNIGAICAVKIAEEVIEVKALKLLLLCCELLILKAYRKSDIVKSIVKLCTLSH